MLFKNLLLMLLLATECIRRSCKKCLAHSNIGIILSVHSDVLPSMQKDAMSKLNEAFPGQEEHTERSTEERSDNELPQE
jgi:hypothetical protein